VQYLFIVPARSSSVVFVGAAPSVIRGAWRGELIPIENWQADACTLPQTLNGADDGGAAELAPPISSKPAQKRLQLFALPRLKDPSLRFSRKVAQFEAILLNFIPIYFLFREVAYFSSNILANYPRRFLFV
jgi:hypothetical protein